MEHSKKTVWILAGLFVMALAGCGGNDDDNSSSGVTPSTSENNQPPSPDGSSTFGSGVSGTISPGPQGPQFIDVGMKTNILPSNVSGATNPSAPGSGPAVTSGSTNSGAGASGSASVGSAGSGAVAGNSGTAGSGVSGSEEGGNGGSFVGDGGHSGMGGVSQPEAGEGIVYTYPANQQNELNPVLVAATGIWIGFKDKTIDPYSAVMSLKETEGTTTLRVYGTTYPLGVRSETIKGVIGVIEGPAPSFNNLGILQPNRTYTVSTNKLKDSTNGESADQQFTFNTAGTLCQNPVFLSKIPWIAGTGGSMSSGTIEATVPGNDAADQSTVRLKMIDPTILKATGIWVFFNGPMDLSQVNTNLLYFDSQGTQKYIDLGPNNYTVYGIRQYGEGSYKSGLVIMPKVSITPGLQYQVSLSGHKVAGTSTPLQDQFSFTTATTSRCSGPRPVLGGILGGQNGIAGMSGSLGTAGKGGVITGIKNGVIGQVEIAGMNGSTGAAGKGGIITSNGGFQVEVAGMNGSTGAAGKGGIITSNGGFQVEVAGMNGSMGGNKGGVVVPGGTGGTSGSSGTGGTGGFGVGGVSPARVFTYPVNGSMGVDPQLILAEGFWIGFDGPVDVSGVNVSFNPPLCPSGGGNCTSPWYYASSYPNSVTANQVFGIIASPSQALAANTTYHVIVTGVKDLGTVNTRPAYSFEFTTGNTACSQDPLTVIPPNETVNGASLSLTTYFFPPRGSQVDPVVMKNYGIRVLFYGPVDTSTANMSLCVADASNTGCNGNSLRASVYGISYTTVATATGLAGLGIYPLVNLVPSTTYLVQLSGLKDNMGNNIPSANYTVRTKATSVCRGP